LVLVEVDGTGAELRVVENVLGAILGSLAAAAVDGFEFFASFDPFFPFILGLNL
jgi:hypothetical protein